MGPARGIPSDNQDGTFPLPTPPTTLVGFPAAVRRKSGAKKRGEHEPPAAFSLAVRPAAVTVCKRERQQRRLVELFAWRHVLPVASRLTPCRECLAPGYYSAEARRGASTAAWVPYTPTALPTSLHGGSVDTANSAATVIRPW